jgi:hypothetical protein
MIRAAAAAAAAAAAMPHKIKTSIGFYVQLAPHNWQRFASYRSRKKDGCVFSIVK